ncbi:hypothetical protein [Marinoscillum furvescens]|uniref:Transposase IS200-like domain-containing protein n=1 Tax=Marinoscillum furvescens DSM 4134 TaxID=1122208 RepID=A0A3D9L1K0_MARFU|nr:hypothetical protein [Marinoscillum furvescens]RED96965.1 hypothetical protein C7460_11313 [Marinoscillum furvescens DSM 4134]
MRPNTYYHVYNHANGEDNLFRCDENYHYFLNLWAKYIELVAGTYAYCLLPNHFHFLIKTHDLATIESLQNEFGSREVSVSQLIKQPFSNCFNSYAKAFNKMYNRRGSLFLSNFKHKEIINPNHLSVIVTYIHRNPVHHGFRNRLGDWPHSSYDAMFGTKTTRLKRHEVRSWYSTPKAYEEAHKQEVKLPDTSLFIDY